MWLPLKVSLVGIKLYCLGNKCHMLACASAFISLNFNKVESGQDAPSLGVLFIYFFKETL